MSVEKIDLKDGKEYISKLTSDLNSRYKGLVNKAQWMSHSIGDKTYFIIGLTDKVTSKAIDAGKSISKIINKANFKIKD